MRPQGQPRVSRPEIALPILKEVTERLGFLGNVGLEYSCWAAAAETLSGGEAQRTRLDTQIGSRPVGVLYILDDLPAGARRPVAEGA